MRRNRRRDSRAELLVRAELHRRGFRYRVDHRVQTATCVVRPDVVLTRARVAVFIDGCFWHRCPRHGVTPRANAEYWRAKLDRNVTRDRTVDRALQADGWNVVRAWEHEDPLLVADRVERAIKRRAA